MREMERGMRDNEEVRERTLREQKVRWTEMGSRLTERLHIESDG